MRFSDWSAPIVTVVKPDKSIRICGDYKVTVNSVSKLDNYPIPKTDDLLADLGGGEYFTKQDMTQAYQQLELDKSSKQYTTINTHQCTTTGITDFRTVCHRPPEFFGGQWKTFYGAFRMYASELLTYCWPGRLVLNI